MKTKKSKISTVFTITRNIFSVIVSYSRYSIQICKICRRRKPGNNVSIYNFSIIQQRLYMYNLFGLVHSDLNIIY